MTVMWDIIEKFIEIWSKYYKKDVITLVSNYKMLKNWKWLIFDD